MDHINIKRPTVGKAAPDFTCHAVVDGRVKDITLSAYTEANHWLVLIFFPRAWSFICPTEILAFSARCEEFLYSRSCAVVFASTDSEYCLRQWTNTSEAEGGVDGVHVPLISDSNHRLSQAYGVLNEEDGTAQRALFVVDPNGILRAMSVNDVDVGRSVDEVQRIIDALAFKDEYGEGCPIDWKKGDKGIDIASKTKVEGRVEVGNRKSWSQWARPQLSRAWSGASHISAASSARLTASSTRVPSNDAGTLPTLSTVNGLADPNTSARQSQRPPSIYLAPFCQTNPGGKHESKMEYAMDMMRAHGTRNEQATLTNRDVSNAA